MYLVFDVQVLYNGMLVTLSSWSIITVTTLQLHNYLVFK